MFRYWDWNVRIVFTMLQDSRLNRSYHSTCVTSRAVLFISVACSLAIQLFMRQHKMAIRKSYRYCSNVEQPSICLTAYVLHGVAAVICADVFFCHGCNLPWGMRHYYWSWVSSLHTHHVTLTSLRLVWHDRTGFGDKSGKGIMHHRAQATHGRSEERDLEDHNTSIYTL